MGTDGEEELEHIFSQIIKEMDEANGTEGLPDSLPSGEEGHE